MHRLLIAGAGLLVLSGAAAAQDVTTAHLAAIDANGDGAVDSSEFETYMVAAFRSIDTDGNGYVTLVEAEGFVAPEQFAAANANGDDGLSRDEFIAAAQADFAKADLDADGRLD